MYRSSGSKVTKSKNHYGTKKKSNGGHVKLDRQVQTTELHQSFLSAGKQTSQSKLPSIETNDKNLEIASAAKMKMSNELQQQLEKLKSTGSDVDSDLEDLENDDKDKQANTLQSEEEKMFSSLSLDELIKKGHELGYPTTIDRAKFEKRVEAHLKIAQEILSGKKESTFYNKAKKYCEESESTNISRISLTYDQMDPPKGYYGYKGVEYMSTTLQDRLNNALHQAHKKTPWMQKFIIAPIIFELVVIPEITIRLISEDQQISYQDASEILEKSDKYGERVFRADDDYVASDDEGKDDSLALTDDDDGNDDSLALTDDGEDDRMNSKAGTQIGTTPIIKEAPAAPANGGKKSDQKKETRATEAAKNFTSLISDDDDNDLSDDLSDD